MVWAPHPSSVSKIPSWLDWTCFFVIFYFQIRICSMDLKWRISHIYILWNKQPRRDVAFGELICLRPFLWDICLEWNRYQMSWRWFQLNIMCVLMLITHFSLKPSLTALHGVSMCLYGGIKLVWPHRYMSFSAQILLFGNLNWILPQIILLRIQESYLLL